MGGRDGHTSLHRVLDEPRLLAEGRGEDLVPGYQHHPKVQGAFVLLPQDTA